MWLLSPERKNFCYSIFVSVLIHGVGVSLVLYSHYSPNKHLIAVANLPDQVNKQRQWVTISMVRSPLHPVTTNPVEMSKEDSADEHASEFALTESVDVEEMVDALPRVPDSEEESAEISVSVARGEGVGNEERRESEGNLLSYSRGGNGGEVVSSEESRGVSVQVLQGSVNQVMRGQRSQLQRHWLQECWYQRNPLRTVQKECDEDPELIASPLEQYQETAEVAFASINRPQQQRRIMQQLERANGVLARLKDDDVVGGLLSTRSRIIQQQLAYLTGNFNDNYWSFVQVSQGVDPQVGFLRYLGVPTCKRGDCVFEYTDPRGNRVVPVQEEGLELLRQNFPLVFDSVIQPETQGAGNSAEERVLQQVLQETGDSEIEGIELESVELEE